MAYRRRQPSFSSTFEDEATRNPNPVPPSSSSSSPNDIDASLASVSSMSSSSLAAKATRASSARRDPSLSSLYGHSNLSNASPISRAEPTPTAPPSSKREEKLERYRAGALGKGAGSKFGVSKKGFGGKAGKDHDGEVKEMWDTIAGGDSEAEEGEEDEEIKDLFKIDEVRARAKQAAQDQQRMKVGVLFLKF